jgi:hypothetical protein
MARCDSVVGAHYHTGVIRGGMLVVHGVSPRVVPMTTSADEIVCLYDDRRGELGQIFESAREIERIVHGEFSVPLPELDQDEKAAVPNLVLQGIEQHGMRIASTVANLIVLAVAAGDQTVRGSGRDRKRAILGWWDANELAGDAPPGPASDHLRVDAGPDPARHQARDSAVGACEAAPHLSRRDAQPGRHVPAGLHLRLHPHMGMAAGQLPGPGIDAHPPEGSGSGATRCSRCRVRRRDETVLVAVGDNSKGGNPSVIYQGRQWPRPRSVRRAGAAGDGGRVGRQRVRGRAGTVTEPGRCVPGGGARADHRRPAAGPVRRHGRPVPERRS